MTAPLHLEAWKMAITLQIPVDVWERESINDPVRLTRRYYPDGTYRTPRCATRLKGQSNAGARADRQGGRPDNMTYAIDHDRLGSDVAFDPNCPQCRPHRTFREWIWGLFKRRISVKLYQCPDCKTIRAEPGPDSPTRDAAGAFGAQCCGGPMDPVAWFGKDGKMAAWRPKTPGDGILADRGKTVAQLVQEADEALEHHRPAHVSRANPFHVAEDRNTVPTQGEASPEDHAVHERNVSASDILDSLPPEERAWHPGQPRRTRDPRRDAS